MPFAFDGELFGFDDERFIDRDRARIVDLLDAFAVATARLFVWFRDGEGRPMRSLEQTRILFKDPGNRNPPLVDGATTHLRGEAACGGLCIYQAGWLRQFRGETPSFDISYRVFPPTRDYPRKRVLMHVNLVRQDGTIENWARMRGMKG